MGRAVTRDVVPQAYGGQGDEDEVESVQQAPVRLQEEEDDGGDDDGEEEEHRAHQGQVDQTHLQETLLNYRADNNQTKSFYETKINGIRAVAKIHQSISCPSLWTSSTMDMNSRNEDN